MNLLEKVYFYLFFKHHFLFALNRVCISQASLELTICRPGSGGIKRPAPPRPAYSRFLLN